MIFFSLLCMLTYATTVVQAIPQCLLPPTVPCAFFYIKAESEAMTAYYSKLGDSNLQTPTFNAGETVFYKVKPTISNEFMLLGNTLSMCGYDGQWTSPPKCLYLLCGNLSIQNGVCYPDNNNVNNATYRLNDQLACRCNSGYSRISGSYTATCIGNNVWVGMPSCRKAPAQVLGPSPSSCDHLPRIADGACQRADGATGRIVVNETVVCLCDPGHTLANAQAGNDANADPQKVVVTCKGFNRWLPLPICIPGPAPCANVPVVANARIDPMINGSFMPGDTYQYHCKDGYNLNGSAIITCLSNGVWTTQPTCWPILVEQAQSICDVLPQMSGGTCEPLVQANGNKLIRGKSSYCQCNNQDRYALTGNPLVECLHRNNWSGVPTCQAKPTCRLQDLGNVGGFCQLPNLNFLGTASVGETARCQCNTDFVDFFMTSPQLEFTCSENGTWLGSRRSCTDVPTCKSLPLFDNGNCDNAGLNEWQPGDTVNCHCNQNYRLLSTTTSTVTCVRSEGAETAMWSARPWCVYVPTSSTTTNAFVTSAITLAATQRDYDCAPPQNAVCDFSDRGAMFGDIINNCRCWFNGSVQGTTGVFLFCGSDRKWHGALDCRSINIVTLTNTASFKIVTGNRAADSDLLNSVIAGNASGVQNALNSGADVDITGLFCWNEVNASWFRVDAECGQKTPLQASVMSKTPMNEIIQLLIDHGANTTNIIQMPNGVQGHGSGNHNFTLIGLSIVYGNLDDVRTLTGRGVSLTATSKIAAGPGLPALHLAATMGRPKILQYLLDQAQADPSVTSQGNQCNALFYALLGLSTPTVKVWLDHFPRQLEEPPCLHDDTSPLMYAVSNGDPSIVDYLISLGVNVNYRSSDGRTPLMIAAKNLRNNDSSEVMLSLLQAGASPSVVEPKTLSTPLMLTALNAYFTNVTEDIIGLANAGARMNATNAFGRTAIWHCYPDAYSVESDINQMECVRLLHERYGLSLFTGDVSGQTFASYCCQQRCGSYGLAYLASQNGYGCVKN